MIVQEHLRRATDGREVDARVSHVGQPYNTPAVNHEPGTYTVYCPVGNHADEGMEVELEVTGS
jgi:hypothetical protein